MSVSFSRPTLLLLQFRVVVRAYDGFDSAEIRSRMAHAVYEYVTTQVHIGDPINIPGLYGMLYQAAGSYASTFAITDLSVSGPFGTALLDRR